MAAGSAEAGGGRIAVYYQTDSGFDFDKLTAPAGLAVYPTQTSGGVGTVYLRDTDEPSGTLIIGSSSNQTGIGVTPLLRHLDVEHPRCCIDPGIQHPCPERARGNGIGLSEQPDGPAVGRPQRRGTRVQPAQERPDPKRGKLVHHRHRDPRSAAVGFGATVIADQIVGTDLTLSQGSLVTSFASTTTQMRSIELLLSGALTVDATSKIDVSGDGYLAGRTTGNTTVGASVGLSGGSHGGLGGEGGASVFDDYLDPDDWGAGGGGGAGGGLVRVTAGSVILDGAIFANGQDGSGSNGNGSVLVQCRRISIRGNRYAEWRRIDEVAGGNTRIGIGGSGGGGRIAVYYQTDSGFDFDNLTAPAGQAVYPTQTSGGAGTVYVLEGVPHTHVRSNFPGHAIDFVDHGNGYVSHSIESITLKFNNAIDLTSFDPSMFLIRARWARSRRRG